MEDLEIKALFGSVYAGRRVLVTGHTGFKGSWLMLWLKALSAEVAGLALDPDGDNAHWDLLGLDLAKDARVDLRDAVGVNKTIQEFQPEVIFHLAAQALVRRSYKYPADTFSTNVGGLVNLLEAARNCGSIKVIVNATTDKVYEPKHSSTGYVEQDPLGGHDPYSTSKACAELVSTCYRRSYFDREAEGRASIKLATARAGNVIGGGDWAEDRLIPDIVRAANSNEPLLLRNPGATRPWQHVLEPISGYLRIGQELLAGGLSGGSWNLGPNPADRLSVGEVVARLQSGWPRLEVEVDTRPHPHEAAALVLDCSKAWSDLGWRPVWTADTTLRRTYEWYHAFLQRGIVLSAADLSAYVTDARIANLAWSL